MRGCRRLMRPTLSSVSNLLSRGACSLLSTWIVTYLLLLISEFFSRFAHLLPSLVCICFCSCSLESESQSLQAECERLCHQLVSHTKSRIEAYDILLNAPIGANLKETFVFYKFKSVNDVVIQVLSSILPLPTWSLPTCLVCDERHQQLSID